MTETVPTTPNTTTTGDGHDPNGSCDVCGHPVSAHDVISARYCAATASGALTRACVCPPAAGVREVHYGPNRTPATDAKWDS